MLKAWTKNTKGELCERCVMKINRNTTALYVLGPRQCRRRSSVRAGGQEIDTELHQSLISWCSYCAVKWDSHSRGGSNTANPFVKPHTTALCLPMRLTAGENFCPWQSKAVERGGRTPHVNSIDSGCIYLALSFSELDQMWYGDKPQQ